MEPSILFGDISRTVFQDETYLEDVLCFGICDYLFLSTSLAVYVVGEMFIPISFYSYCY